MACDVGDRVDLGHHDGGRAGRGGGGEVVGVPLGVEAVDPDGQLSLGAVLAGGDRGADPLAGLGLGVGGDGVLEVEDEGVGGEALGLLEGPLVGAGHVEDRAAGAEGRRRLIVRPPSRRSRSASASSGSRSASCWARSTMTWHCFTEASSSIFPSIITAPVPSPISSMTSRAWATSAGSGREDPLGDVDLHRVEAPGADAAEQEGVAELVLAGDDVLDVAEGAVEREDPVGDAGVDHAGDRVVPQVLLVDRAAARRCRRRSGPGAPGSRGGRRRPGWSSCGGWRPGRRGRARGPACGGWPRRSPRRWPRRGRSRGWRGRAAAR